MQKLIWDKKWEAKYKACFVYLDPYLDPPDCGCGHCKFELPKENITVYQNQNDADDYFRYKSGETKNIVDIDPDKFSRENYDSYAVNIEDLFNEALKTYTSGTIVLKIPRSQKEIENVSMCKISLNEFAYLKKFLPEKLIFFVGWDGCGYITLTQICVEYLRESLKV